MLPAPLLAALKQLTVDGQLIRKKPDHRRKAEQDGKESEKRGGVLLRLPPDAGGLDGGNVNPCRSRALSHAGSRLALPRATLRHPRKPQLLSNSQSARVSFSS